MCAGFYVDMHVTSPFGDTLDLNLRLLPPAEESKYGANDWTGLQFNVDGRPYLNRFDALPHQYGTYGKHTMRIDICPSDDRDFQARQDAFANRPTALLDANGAPFNGWVYCNMAVRVESRDEYAYFSGQTKGYRYDSEGMSSNMCTDSSGGYTIDPFNPPYDHHAKPYCYNPVLSDVFDGSDEETGGYQYVTQNGGVYGSNDSGEQYWGNVASPFVKDVIISCLSFDKSGDACAANPCGNGDGPSERS